MVDADCGRPKSFTDGEILALELLKPRLLITPKRVLNLAFDVYVLSFESGR